MNSSKWLYVGLGLVTFATLLLELLDSRLLSVLTWYHLSFLAVSLAMLGMAAGAVLVFQIPWLFDGIRAVQKLPALAGAAAIAIILSHLVNLSMPIPPLNRFEAMEVVAIAMATVILAVPFCILGVAVTVALTKSEHSIARLYAADLLGAALACISIVPLLDSARLNLTSLVMLSGAAAAGGGWCFARFLGRRGLGIGLLTLACCVAAVMNGAGSAGIDVAYPKNRQLWLARSTVDQARWNSHSYVIVQKPTQEKAFLWGPGRATPDTNVTVSWLAIDGEAGTAITKWNGDVHSIAWVQHDVTALPYHLRHGSAAVVGVGGGRDILSAIAMGNRSITGIDVNATMIDVLTGSYRTFAGIADYPGVKLVHDDARAYLTRTRDHFDVIQMSLIDTWAATGAGAFTLSENGLYTVEAWRVFLSRLTANGVFSVSRWFAPQNVSETNRLLALGVGALLHSGCVNPLEHILLVSRGGTATLVLSAAPFGPSDADIVERVAQLEEFTIHVSPWTRISNTRLDRISRSRSDSELIAAAADPMYDYTPPTDERPFFFNMLKLSSFTRASSLPRGGVLWGNMRATGTLVVLFSTAAVLVLLLVILPLILGGRVDSAPRVFIPAIWYFAAIGLAFMLVQIALLQRFSIYLGHPMYTFAVTLFSMILFAGLGSALSERLPPRISNSSVLLPLSAALAILIVGFSVQPITDRTIQWGLLGRITVVAMALALIATVLGFFFPTGLRLIMRQAPQTAPWMWGINGAFGVLGSIAAVGVSIWIGIQVNLFVAALLYGSLAIPLSYLQALEDVSEKPLVKGSVLGQPE